MQSGYREAIREFISDQARPVDKFSHQARVYRLSVEIGRLEQKDWDDDVLYAAAWMHDLGVFVGHRPEQPEALPTWDHVGYVTRVAPGVLERLGFPVPKIPAVLEAIRSHLASATPATYEGTLLRDADILEQLGAVGILRTVSKIGRDTRFTRFSDALRVLQNNLQELPDRLGLPSARKMAESRIQVLWEFLVAAASESGGIEW